MEQGQGTFVKVSYRDDAPVLVARTKKDIAAAAFGDLSYERPLVFFESAQESVEKGLWLYSKNILPLVAEDNLELTCMAACRYGIDAIVGDAASLLKVAAFLDVEARPPRPRYPELAKVTHLVLIGPRAAPNSLGRLARAFPAARLQTVSA